MKQHPVFAIHRVSREWTPVFDEHLEPVVQDWTEKKPQIRLNAQDLRAMKQQMVDQITEVVLSWEPAAEQPDPAFANRYVDGENSRRRSEARSVDAQPDGS